MSEYDVVVVGGGPSGLAAAVAAVERGLRVALVDASSQLGGQYWRRPDEQVAAGSRRHHRRRFDGLCDRAEDVDQIAEHQVWLFEPGGAGEAHTLHLAPAHAGVKGDAPAIVRARSVVLCPGAYDRQLPVPGWDLPGVMAAGGVQVLAKAHRALAGKRVVVAGTGPFLLPVAKSLVVAGAEVVSLCEANGIGGWVRSPLRALAVPSKVVEAARYAATMARHRIRFRARTIVSAIEGEDRIRAVRLRHVDRSGSLIAGEETVEGVDVVALGWGFTPSLELVLAAGASTRVDVDESLVASVDDWQRTDVSGVYVAGEATGVGGALLALAEGEIAGLAVACDQGRTVDVRRVRHLQRVVGRGRAFATAMHRAYPVPASWADWLEQDTTLCRCEEVTVGEVREACDALGAAEARTAKLLARPGMGWCQGRVCGFATAKLVAGERWLTTADLSPMGKRPLATPVSLARLAGEESHQGESSD